MNEQQIDVFQEQTEQQVNVESELSVLHGIDGVSPIANVVQTETGATITITDRNGTTTADILNGEKGEQGEAGRDGTDGRDGVDGQDGRDGVDGVSATVAVGRVQTGGAGTSAVITNVGTSRDAVFNFTIPRGDKGEAGQNGTNGRDGRDGVDGQNGQDGQDGEDGFSPTASVVKVGDTATITITDKNGTTTASVSDGTTPTLATVATTGDYDDLIDKPTIPTAGTITSGSTGYATGGDVYTAIGNVETILSTLNNGGGAQ